eukprot:6416023-Alexandrium_andersonii.AAC.1
MDLETGMVGFYPTSARGSYERKHFAGADPLREMYCDGAREFRKAKHDLIIPGDFSVPGRHETNGIAEACVKRLSRCVRALLELSLIHI